MSILTAVLICVIPNSSQAGVSTGNMGNHPVHPATAKCTIGFDYPRYYGILSSSLMQFDRSFTLDGYTSLTPNGIVGFREACLTQVEKLCDNLTAPDQIRVYVNDDFAHPAIVYCHH